MQEEDLYRCLAGPAQASTKIKGSRFIGEAIPVENEEAALTALQVIRKRAYTATHHCWAFRIGIDQVATRFNDDGEPGGTAGQPILRHIEGREVTNALVVVTRYYGGTKLGTGGLIRAYGDAAGMALDAASIEERIREAILSVRFGYHDTSAAMHTIHQYKGRITSSEYGDDTLLKIAIPRSLAAEFIAMITDRLAGRVSLEQDSQ